MHFKQILVIFLFYIPGLFTFGNPDKIGITEKLEDTIPMDIKLVNTDFDTVLLGDYLDKPTVLALVYYRCASLCSPLMTGISELIDDSDMKIGEEYQVLTISFDAKETAALAKEKGKNYISNMEKSAEAKRGWYFFATDSMNVARLTQSVGFGFKPQGTEFLHTASLILVNQEGVISRYLNGVEFTPMELKLSVIEASKGNTLPPLNKVLQYCFTYDPVNESYVVNIFRVAGILIVFLSTLLFVTLIIRSLKKKKR